jgi:hypothetical protein
MIEYMNIAISRLLVILALIMGVPLAGALSLNRVSHDATLNFPPHAVTLPEAERAALNAFGVKVGKACYELEVILLNAGFSKPVTLTKADAKLLDARLAYIKEFLVRVHGVDPARIYVPEFKRGRVSQIPRPEQHSVQIESVGKYPC